MNDAIIVPQVRLIDADGSMVGVVSSREAMDIARQRELDLVEIVPNAEPPVCKIMNFGKYKYELNKKMHDAKKKQKTIEIKEIKVRPNIAEGDYATKLKKVRGFIAYGDKVKISLQFRGREITHNEIGFGVISRFIADTADIAKVEAQPKLEGKQIATVIIPI